MLRFNSQQQKEDAYRKRISELHEELEAASRDLMTVTSQRDIARGELTNILKHKEVLHTQISQQTREIIGHNDSIASLTSSHRKEMEDHEVLTTDREREVVSLQETARLLLAKIAALEKEKDAYEELGQKLAEAQGGYQETLKKNLSLKSQNADLAEQNRRKATELDAQERDIDDKIEKHGKILVDTEDKLRTLEIYVRRLQRYYDKEGLNVQILDVFGVKRDNNDGSEQPEPQ